MTPELKYKMLKHFFGKSYGIEFDSFYNIQNVSDITSEADAKQYVKLMQVMHFSDSALDTLGLNKVDVFRDELFTKRVEFQNELDAISNGSDINSEDANRAIGLYYIITVLKQVYSEYTDILKDTAKLELISTLFLPPKNDYIRKIENDVKFYRTEITKWCADFVPGKYTDDANSDIKFPTINPSIEIMGEPYDDPFGSDEEYEE